MLKYIDLLPANAPPGEGLQLLQRFCQTGVHSKGLNGDAVLLAKELLYYRVLDVFAQVYGVGLDNRKIERSNFPFINLLVRTFMNFLWHWSTLTSFLPSEPLQPRALA